MSVRLFYSTETGLGGTTGVAGSVIAFLDKVLVNGFNSQSLTSIARTGSVATVTKNSHGFRSGQTVTQAGWDQAEYNGNFVISNVSTNTYDITVSGTPTTPGTGATPTAKVTPIGWTKPFSGTNLAAYRPAAGNQFYLRIDDTGTTQGRMIGYESMTDVNTGTNGFPTNTQFAGGLYWPKSSTANATERAVICVGDEKRIYVFCDQISDSSSLQGVFFGDIVTYKATDAYHTLIIGQSTATVGSGSQFYTVNFSPTTAVAGHYLARTYTQLGGSITAAKHHDYTKSNQTTGMGSNGLTYPDVVSGSLNVSPVWVTETSPGALRGEMPGLLSPLHNKPLAHLDTYAGTDDYAGLSFLALNIYSAAQAHVQISGTLP